MFLRRLLLIAGGGLLAAGVLVLRAAELTLLEGDARLAEARLRLVQETWVPSTRGKILDRHGRVLAYERPSYGVMVPYPVLTGAWAEEQARRFARRAHGQDWSELTGEQRDRLVSQYLPAYERRLEEMWLSLADATELGIDELDRRRDRIVERVTAMHRSIAESRRQRLLREANSRGAPPTPDELRTLERRAWSPIAEQRGVHMIAGDVGDEAGFRLMRLVELSSPVFLSSECVGPAASLMLQAEAPLLPGVTIRNEVERVYPFDETEVRVARMSLPPPLREPAEGQTLPEEIIVTVRGVAQHAIGSMRERVYSEDGEARSRAVENDPWLRHHALTASGQDRGAYREGDAVGALGIEASFEHELRGLRGVRTVRLDTNETSQVPPTPGRDVTLTIDAALQARVQAALSPEVGLAVVQPWHNNEEMPAGTPLSAAVVVLDIPTGELLALASSPDLPADGVFSEDDAENERFVLERQPWVNRAIAKPYPPGSIAKALVLCGAVDAGVYQPGERIEATGHLLPGRPDRWRSWIFKDFGITHFDQLGRHPDAVDALMVSSNVFFFTLGERLGVQRVIDVYRSFGLGEPFDLGLGVEYAGGWTSFDDEPMRTGHARLMGIGQGPLTWTPLHAADAFATIARGGVRIKPRVVMGGLPEADDAAPDIALSPRGVSATLAGLDWAVNDASFGTGNHINYGEPHYRVPIFDTQGLRVWGKTGTAQASDLRVDRDGDGELDDPPVAVGSHSWFVVMVAPAGEPPRYAISVLIEHGGSGGRASGPVVNQVIRALRAEGYLPEGQESAVASGAS